jgi:hypothetical protein
MRHLKMFAVAVVAATALVAIAAAGSASATVLCMTNTTPCGEVVPKAKALELNTTAGGAMFIKAGFTTIECTGSQIKGDVAESGGLGLDVRIPITATTFSGCSCPVTVLKTGTLYLSSVAGTMNANARLSGFEWATECGGVKCVFGSEATFAFTGGGPAELATGTSGATAGSTIPKKEGSFLCNSSSAWMVAYEVTNTKPLYASSS